MTNFNVVTQKVLEKISDLLENQKKSVITIFDLDSTLFNVTKRSQQILRDFANEPEIKKSFPSETQILKQIETFHDDWGVRTAVERNGIHDPDLFLLLRNYWVEHFFSSHYLDHDFPYDGAVDFVNQVWNLGSHITYLTGRDTVSMLDGTITSLQSWNFPLNKNRVELQLKPGKHLVDVDYKENVIRSIENQFDYILYFENEPVIVNRILKQIPKVDIIYMDSVHSGKEEISTELPTLAMRF